MAQRSDIQALIATQARHLQTMGPGVPSEEPGVRHNLTGEPPYFFGREPLLGELIRELEGRNQVVVLMGFGGIGKSTLAKKLAYQCLRDGLFKTVAWVDLRRYHELQRVDLGTVLDVIARASDPLTAITQIGDLEQKADEVIRMLSRRATLLVLDNFESVVHSTEEAAICDFVGRLPLVASAGATGLGLVRVMVTTRQLSPHLEELRPRIHLVPELSLPETTRLIDRRLEDLGIDLALGGGYVRLHEMTCGIPYLTEFAVGQLRHLTLREIQEGFDFHPPSEGSDHIHDYLFRRTWEQILSSEQQRILMATTFFVDHAPRDGLAATVGMSARMLSRHIRGLCDMCLLAPEYSEERIAYRVHPLTQKMCEARIGRNPEFAAAAGRQFVRFYVDYAERCHRATPRDMEREVRNILAAVDLAESLAEWGLLARLHDPINHFLFFAGYWRERIAVGESILRACNATGDRALEARVLVEDIGFTYLRFEELATAERYVTEGLRAYEELGDRRGTALAIRHLGKSALLKGEYEWLEQDHDWEYYFESSVDLYSRSLRLREEIRREDPAEEIALADLELDFGRLYWLWGRKCERDGRASRQPALVRRAQQLYSRSIRASDRGRALFEAHDNRRGLAKALGNLGNAVRQQASYLMAEGEENEAISRLTTARGLYTDSLAISQGIDKVDEIAHAKWGLAEVDVLISQLRGGDKAALGSALALARDSHELYGRMATPADERVTGELVDRIRAELGRMGGPVDVRAPGGEVEGGEDGDLAEGRSPRKKPYDPRIRREKGAGRMLEVIGIPILMKAVDFLFEEGRKILEERRARRQASLQEVDLARPASAAPDSDAETAGAAAEQQESKEGIRTREELLKLQLSEPAWLAHRDTIQHLLSLRDTYMRNYQLAEEQYAKWTSSLVPPIVVHNMEEAEQGLIATMENLRRTLSDMYDRDIVVPELKDEIG